MRVLSGVAIFLFLLSANASADGYRDFNAGLTSAERWETDSAIALLTHALSEPGLPEHLLSTAYLARGREYFELNKYDAAIADFSAALRVKPDDIEALLLRCAAYDQANRYADALTDCSAAISLRPRNWRLRLLRVGIYRETRKFDEAAAEYSEFIGQRPNDGDLLLGRAEMFRLAGKYDKAIADAQAAHRLNQGWTRPYFESALIYFAKNDLPNALDSYDSLVSLARRDSLPRLLKGQVEWAMGRFGDASESFEDSLDREALQGYALMWLEISLSRQGHKPKPSTLAPFFNTQLSGWPGPLVSVYLGKSQPPDALTLHGQDPDNGDDFQCSADFFVGEWYQMQGNASEAKRLLRDTASTCVFDWRTRQMAVIDLGRIP